MKVTVKQQIQLTIKLLLTLLAEPKIRADRLAKSLGVSQGWVYLMTMRLREAGLDIEYDRNRGGQYSVALTPELQEGILGKYAARLKRQLTDHSRKFQPVSFVSAIDRYSVRQFAEYLGTTPQNIGNMLQGYRGQSLPEGWVGFQVSERGKWFIQKMIADRSGKHWTVPDNVKNGAFSYVTGRGDLKVSGPKPAFKQCYVPYDMEGKSPHHEPVLSFGLCNRHYFRARDHAEEVKVWKRDAREAAAKRGEILTIPKGTPAPRPVRKKSA